MRSGKRPARAARSVGEEQAHLFLVADGMGGHRAGERASHGGERHRALHVESFKWFSAPTVARRRVLAQFQTASRKPMPQS